MTARARVLALSTVVDDEPGLLQQGTDLTGPPVPRRRHRVLERRGAIPGEEPQQKAPGRDERIMQS